MNKRIVAGARSNLASTLAIAAAILAVGASSARRNRPSATWWPRKVSVGWLAGGRPLLTKVRSV